MSNMKKKLGELKLNTLALETLSFVLGGGSAGCEKPTCIQRCINCKDKCPTGIDPAV